MTRLEKALARARDLKIPEAVLDGKSFEYIEAFVEQMEAELARKAEIERRGRAS
jgi:hypothetical protein